MSGIGPSKRAVCRIINQSSCGSGSICGINSNGNALILTNAHVAGTRVGRVVQVDVEATGDRIQARVIMAAYSNRTLADWAILETLAPYGKVEPVKLSKNAPSGSHYTKGFPRCRAFAGTNITTVDISDNSPLWRWLPNAIAGQSGSGIWNDDDNLQYGIVTWTYGGYGAGQTTYWTYLQARNRNTVGPPKIDGLMELTNADLADPIVEEGFYAEANIVHLPIWAEDEPDDIPNDPSPSQWRKYLINRTRRQIEALEEEMKALNKNTIGTGINFFGALVAMLLLPLMGKAAEPPAAAAPVPAPINFFEPQDCSGGVCPAPMISSTVTRSRQVFRPVQFFSGAVQHSTTPQLVERLVPRTEIREKVVQVPKVVYEEKVIQEQVTVYDTVQEWVCPPVVQYAAPVQTYSPPVQRTRTVNRTYSGGGMWFPGRRVFQRLRSARARTRNVSFSRGFGVGGYVYQPLGQSLSGHLMRDHGVNTAGMSYQQMLSLHTQLH